ncbi:Oidioi.mRNA.OKI2018_I69.chr2.g7846.t1.cds [Oikopleura dioica]|uniref:Oidioi.mRNA.OKI2018_I69.chr2.g7846.t1.cds n=1 Tax=Oikopleura dioica TaxID=34765 RepID=A0ABN7TG01_OIKDI|nr:Oidioi.mRNA.OKI2018_I69.chr2.g7846.t1.cds [Oikopleura dioica]
MKIEEREHEPEINEDDPEEITEANPEATDDTNTFLEDDFGGFGEATANPSVEFNASFGEHANANQPQEDGDDDDFGDFGETNEAGDDDFGDFGGDDDFGDFSQTVAPPPQVPEVVNDLEPVSLGPVWEELKAATSYEQEEPEKTQYAWEERQESIDKLNDFLNASALDLTWNSSATKKMFEYIMPKFLQLTRDVEKEREAELEKIRKDKEEQSATKNAMSNGAKEMSKSLFNNFIV